ncbi:MAG TPA: recombinase family protein, partial [Dehalococcoidia bacterium]|nr:recombinase family protein [Dehalococcoidia bacterium]
RVGDGGRQRVKLSPVSAEAEVVRRFFRRVLEGKGLMEITRELNSEGISGPRGKGWGKTSVHQTLRNEVYTGTLVWGRTSVRKLPPIRVENAWPAIVDRETFEAVQKRLADRGPRIVHPRRTSSRYLLSGLARCGHCGKALVGQAAKGGKFAYYVCGTLLKKGPKTCSTAYLPAAKFEGAVIDKIRERILTEENLKELVRLVNEEMDTVGTEFQERLETVNAEIADVSQRLERLYDALETGKLTMDDLSPRIQQLRERQKQLNAAKWELEALLADRHLELADEKTVRRFVEDLRVLLVESPLTERRAFIRSFVKEVKVTCDRAILTYTMPMPPKALTEEGVPVPRIVQYGGRWGT